MLPSAYPCYRCHPWSIRSLFLWDFNHIAVTEDEIGRRGSRAIDSPFLIAGFRIVARDLYMRKVGRRQYKLLGRRLAKHGADVGGADVVR